MKVVAPIAHLLLSWEGPQDLYTKEASLGLDPPIISLYIKFFYNKNVINGDEFATKWPLFAFYRPFPF